MFGSEFKNRSSRSEDFKEGFYRRSILFSANRYEVWEAGKCIDSGEKDVEVKGIANDSQITFVLSGADGLPLAKRFSFGYSNRDADVLSDRIQYMIPTKNGGNYPAICNLFTDRDNSIKYVRFATLGPAGFKLIEFYGTQIIGGVITDDGADEDDGYGWDDKESIPELVKINKQVRKHFWNMFSENDDDDNKFRWDGVFDLLENALFYTWEELGCGHHTDFYEEGDSMFGYLMFLGGAKERISALLELLENQSPFEVCRDDLQVTERFLSVFRKVLKKL